MTVAYYLGPVLISSPFPVPFERDLIVLFVFFFPPVNRYKLKDSLHLNEISVILSINIYVVPNVLKQKKIDARNKSSCKG